MTQILLSPLTQPTKHFPIYLYEEDKLYVYPTDIQEDVTFSYVKTPADPNWAFGVGSLGQFVFQPVGPTSASVDFELAISEQTNIIMRVLAYAGVIIQDSSIVQTAAQAVANQDNNEKQ